MLRTLRNRLVLSHVLPLMIVIPLVGVALLYALETDFIVPALAREVEQDAQLLARMVRHHGEAWHDPQVAQSLLGDRVPSPDKRVMLLTPEGRILASNDIRDAQRIDDPLAAGEWAPAARERPLRLQRLDPILGAEVIDVFYPVWDQGGEVEGIVRISHRYSTLSEDLLRLRNLVSTILIAGLIGGTALGLLLATSIGRPLARVTTAVHDLAQGEQAGLLAEEGPEEVRVLLNAVNYLVERRRQLETAQRQLLANLVHELGRPLGALRLALQALQRGATEDPALRDEFFQGMDEGLARLEVLVEDLAGLQDEMVGELSLHRRRVELETWLSAVLHPWQVVAAEKGLQWQLTVEEPGLDVLADPIRLSQALGNLVANAVKYTPAGGSVAIRAGAAPARQAIWIGVGDSGPGIPADEQERIFQPFFRGSQEQRIKQGMGLGLGIARQLIVAHGGTIELDSAPGRGSTFTVWLPGLILADTADEGA